MIIVYLYLGTFYSRLMNLFAWFTIFLAAINGCFISVLTKILSISSMACGQFEVHSPTKCRDSWQLVRSRLSDVFVKRAVTKWTGTAPSASASSCIRFPMASFPSSIMAFISRPAPWRRGRKRYELTNTSFACLFFLSYLDNGVGWLLEQFIESPSSLSNLFKEDVKLFAVSGFAIRRTQGKREEVEHGSDN